MASLGLMSGYGNSSYIPNQSQSVRVNKDAINNLPAAPKPVSVRRDFSGGDNPYKHYRKADRNQRQYRKWMRQCPHMRRSKKCKL